MNLRNAAWRVLVASCLMTMASLAHAASSVLIWPLNPGIAAGQRAAALWLQNVGTQPVVLQVRVLAWDQHEGADRYAQQAEIIGTPPFTTLAPGAKQLIRLTAMQPAPPGREQAYRVLIDEIPSTPAAERDGADSTQAALRLQMRYSLPLFVYGAGLRAADAQADGQAGADRAPAAGDAAPLRVAQPAAAPQTARPQLSWRIAAIDGVPHLLVTNRGTGHARLSQVSLLGTRDALPVAAGLLGYVLPGKQMRWPLPQAPSAGDGDMRLRLQLGSRQPLMEIPMDASSAERPAD